ETGAGLLFGEETIFADLVDFGETAVFGKRFGGVGDADGIGAEKGSFEIEIGEAEPSVVGFFADALEAFEGMDEGGVLVLFPEKGDLFLEFFRFEKEPVDLRAEMSGDAFGGAADSGGGGGGDDELVELFTGTLGGVIGEA